MRLSLHRRLVPVYQLYGLLACCLVVIIIIVIFANVMNMIVVIIIIIINLSQQIFTIKNLIMLKIC